MTIARTRFLCLGLVGVLLLALLPELAMAQSANPNGPKSAWDLWVMGNGAVIADIMTAVKLMLTPAPGGTIAPLRMLMMLVATIGVVVLAVGAATSPTKNLPRLLAYLFVAWVVVFGSANLKSNLTINDPVTGYHNTVTDVPAIVAIPASLVSQVGHALTRLIEANFNVPGLTLTDVGQFNIFGKVMADAETFRIMDPALKQSLTAYVADCVIPAIARGRLSTQELMTSTNLWETFKKAEHPGILTSYWPAMMESKPGAMGLGNGQLVSCTDAYHGATGGIAGLSKDLETHASELLEAKSSAWETTGTLVPYETVMSNVLSQATMGGRTGANVSRPQGFILQNAMVSATTGSMRTAAMMAGNNELMQATAIAQGETSQRSTWIAAAKLFENMTGYVYTVLQAFIFAIAPVILVALLIPGLGRNIFTNYGQILIWLTLWAPLLALINYLVVVFAKQAFVGSWGAAGGITMQSAGLVSEQTNNLIAAAQFMGTMVPLITWGLVKGTMAFTEFIQAGIGSSFASQAGAQAATGNVSMGNLSMDNTSMNKYNTAMSASVGAMATEAFSGSTALNMRGQYGGSTIANAAGMEAMQQKVEQSYYKGEAISKSTAEQIQSQIGKQRSLSTSVKEALSQSGSQSNVGTLLQSLAKSLGVDTKESASEGRTASDGEDVSTGGKLSSSGKTSADASLGAKAFGFGGGTTVSTDSQRTTEAGVQKSASLDEKTAHERAQSIAQHFGLTDSESISAIKTFLVSASKSWDSGSSEGISQAATKLSSDLEQRADSLSSSLTTSVAYTTPGGSDAAFRSTGMASTGDYYQQQSGALSAEVQSIIGSSGHLGADARASAAAVGQAAQTLAATPGAGLTPGGPLQTPAGVPTSAGDVSRIAPPVGVSADQLVAAEERAQTAMGDAQARIHQQAVGVAAQGQGIKARADQQSLTNVDLSKVNPETGAAVPPIKPPDYREPGGWKEAK